MYSMTSRSSLVMTHNADWVKSIPIQLFSMVIELIGRKINKSYWISSVINL